MPGLRDVTENMGFTAIGLTVLAICVQSNPHALLYNDFLLDRQ